MEGNLTHEEEASRQRVVCTLYMKFFVDHFTHFNDISQHELLQKFLAGEFKLIVDLNPETGNRIVVLKSCLFSYVKIFFTC